MSLLDNLKGALGGAMGQAEAAALPAIIAKVMPGGLQGLLDQLSQSGYGQQVSSWLGNGANQPITVEQLRTALGNAHIDEIAQHLGIPADKAMGFLSSHLPGVVDQLSPSGNLQQSN